MALGAGFFSKIRNHGRVHVVFFHVCAFQHNLSGAWRRGGSNLAALGSLMLLCMSVWAALSGVTGKYYLGNFKDCLTATLGCVNILWKYSHLAMSTGCSPPCRALLSGEAFLRDAQAGFTKRPNAGGLFWFLSQYLINQLAWGGMFYVFSIQQKSLPFEGAGGVSAQCKSSGSSSRDDPWPNPVCLGGSSGCYVDTFFYLFNETSFLPFQRRGGFDVMCWWVTAFNRPASRDWECCLEQPLC